MTAPPADLASILQTLSAYAPQQPQPDLSYTQDFQPEEYDPSQYDPTLALALQSATSNQHQQYQHFQADAPSQGSSVYHTAPEHLTPSPPAPVRSKPSTPAPAAPPPTNQITTYAVALRHITTHLLPLPQFKARVQHLISTQYKHERQWHAGRQTLLTKLAGRESSRAKLDAVLASIGGKAGASAGDSSGKMDSVTGELGKEEELKVYDRKIWRAQREMVAAAERELEKLGVPFFEAEVGRRWEGKEKELEGLQGRVLGLLDDLCGEEGA